jgi:hypothetical protein
MPALDNDQLAKIMFATAGLPREKRGIFLERVAARPQSGRRCRIRPNAEIIDLAFVAVTSAQRSSR